MVDRALIIAAHPDDEVLGCGGTMAKLAAGGTDVHVLFLADGVTARQEQSVADNAALERRRAAAGKACSILGASGVEFEDYPDNRMDTIALLSIAQSVESRIAAVKPELILTHYGNDLNIDHQRINQAVVTACRPQNRLCVKTLLFFEVGSSTEWQTPDFGRTFAPNWFEDISPFLEQKLQAMSAYEEELRDWPHPRSLKGIESLAAWRGASIGCDAAEAFVLGRRTG
ncbi:PIG-L deacetylase family protein [Mariluticola halotolerans]|uniref:PIG-L deacetylase family protein n=1 Tax=Mariluticola halotolerans TaxID=2909283 RepID=UPI0026E171BF|nr:PIG-L deacetylase family protein [Mariluticola halotolerans]UJQ96055.1 PIG-L family deacetylase [Mariluticola halotolerans]